MFKKYIPGHFLANDSWVLVIAAAIAGLTTHSLLCAIGMSIAVIGFFISSQARHLAQPDHSHSLAPTAIERELQRHTSLWVITGFWLVGLGVTLAFSPPNKAVKLLQEPLFVIALVLYTGAIIKQWVTGRLNGSVLLLFGIGLAADALGTLFVCTLKTGVWRWNLHTVAGLAAILIMAIHFSWAIGAKMGSTSWKKNFHTGSPFAWLIWVVAFVTGIPIALGGQIGIGVAILFLSLNIGAIWRFDRACRQEGSLLEEFRY